MCDMDCGDIGGYDMDIDIDSGEGIDYESGADIAEDIEVESSFEDLDFVDDDGSSSNSFELNDMDEYAEDTYLDEVVEASEETYTLDDIESFIDTTDDISELNELRDILTSGEYGDSDLSTLSLEGIEECEDGVGEDATQELELESQLTLSNEVLDEIIEENSDNVEFLENLEAQMESGRIVAESEEFPDEDDSPKVLTREFTPELQASRELDTEEVLDNYRENLREYGVDEERIEDFITQEREQINLEYESLDNGETSSNIYESPNNWSEIASSLMGSDGMEATTDITDIEIEAEDITQDILTELEESSESFENISEKIEDDSELTENLLQEDIPEELEEDFSQVVYDEPEEMTPVETTEMPVQESVSEGLHDEISEIDYDAIYNDLSREQLAQGFEEINIDADPERLDSSLRDFEDEAWETLSLDDQKNSISNLAGYVVESIGFNNPPRIEYYNNPREGDYGGYDQYSNTLHINEYMLYNSSEAADTVAHELWHAHQFECASNPQSARDYQYQYNFENYISPELGHEAYENQLIEAEARAFAEQFKERLSLIKGRTR